MCLSIDWEPGGPAQGEGQPSRHCQVKTAAGKWMIQGALALKIDWNNYFCKMVAVECSDKLFYLWFYIAQLSFAWFIVQSGSTKNSVLPTTGNIRYDFHSMVPFLSICH